MTYWDSKSRPTLEAWERIAAAIGRYMPTAWREDSEIFHWYY